MATALKVVGSIVGLLLVVIVVFLATFDINDWKGWLAEQATAALGLYLGEDTNVPINCLATDFEIADGVAQTKLGVLDTTDSVIEIEGNVDLGKERLDLEITPHPKDVSLLNFRSKVHVEGTFVEPAISLDVDSILKFVPLIDLGLAENAPCQSLLARAREDGD